MGQPFILEEWQRAIVCNLFGWLRKDGTRRYREALIYVPRKNGKTELAGGLGCLMLFADREPGAQIYCAAADRDQARLVFTAARSMVQAEPELSSRAQVLLNSIVVPETSSVLKVISAEAYTKHGANAHGVIIDELHSQPNSELVDVLMTSTGARRQPLVIHITTADFDRESICNRKYDYARKVRDGVVDDPAFLPVIYDVPVDADWTSREVWAKSNPNLGVSVSVEYLTRECARAQVEPTYENTFKRLHLNMRTQQNVRWLTLEAWDRCNQPVDLERLAGLPCVAGLDLSATTDLTALVLVWGDQYSGVSIWPWFWAPEDKAPQREKKDRVPYLTWARQGMLELTPGAVVDYDVIRSRIGEISKRFGLHEIAVDPWNSTQLATQLISDGFEVVHFGQGFRDMSAPTKELERMVVSGNLRHGGHPILRWMASHVAVDSDAAGNLKPSKAKSTERIDGIVATVMGIGRAMIRSGSGSVYDSSPLVAF